MSGLLKRSTQYRKNLLVDDNVKPSDLLSTDDSGISAEDRTEILREIDRMTSDQRAGLSPDALVVSRATRRGFLFPLVVNLAMAVILAGGLYGLYAFFQQEEQQRAGAQREGVAGQAELIRRIQEQAQAELEQKEREIASIQDRLGDIEARRAALETNLEEELARREAELRAELEAELEAARARLSEQGATEAQIEQRITTLEAEGEAEIQAELAELRAEAEAERAELDETLAQLQSEFRGELEQLEQERSQILEEAREREQELRSGFEEQLSDARSELETLTERRQREQQAANQIVGYYNEIRGEIRAENYGAALSTIEQLRSFLAEDSVAGLPAVARRRETELFILSSLEQLVADEQDVRTTDTDALLAQARTVQEATRLVNEGNAAFEQGNVEQAEELYREAIDLIPAVAEGHDYFVTQLEEQQAERSEAAEAAISNARASFAAADYGAALASYQEAVSLLPQDAAPVAEIISEIRASGVALADQQAVERQTQSAAATFEQGEDALAAGNYGAALTAFTTVAENYPRSRQMALVPQAIRTTVAERTAELQSRLDALQSQIATLEEQTDEQEETSEERQEQLVALRSENVELQTRVEELRDELEAAREAAEAADAQADEQAAEEAAPELTAELEQELAELREIEQRYRSLRQSYLAYADREDDILDSGTDAARLQTKLLFDSFLASRPVRETLPGLRDRIKAYDRAFEEVGRETALLDTVDIVYELSTYEGTDAKLDYLDEQRAATDDPNMAAFLDELEVLIRATR